MRKILIVGLSFIALCAFAQDDLMAELEQQADPEVIYALQTFKGTRIINGQSVETKGKGELEFIFSHRFGRINSGSYNFWGLDDAFVRLGLEYGLTDRLGVGVGRTSVDKTFDGYLRYKLFRQSSGAVNFPVTITAIGTTYIKTSPRAKDNPQFAMEDRMAYSAGLLIARKLNSNLSLQLTPVYVHRNAVVQFNENNDDMALGFGGRYKVTRSVALSGEYYYRLNAKSNSPNFDSVGFGVDIETGGHVFQLVFTNSAGMFERALISETTGDFFSGDVHFGFNITRNFQIVKKK
jgi:opacity protein-like surface antigen